jgi:hypothetical protein
MFHIKPIYAGCTVKIMPRLQQQCICPSYSFLFHERLNAIVDLAAMKNNKIIFKILSHKKINAFWVE